MRRRYWRVAYPGMDEDKPFIEYVVTWSEKDDPYLDDARACAKISRFPFETQESAVRRAKYAVIQELRRRGRDKREMRRQKTYLEALVKGARQ